MRLFFLLFFLFTLFPRISCAQEGDSVKGKVLFNSNCAACHKLDKKMTGPALRGVETRFDREWIYKWVKNSSALIKAGDSDAVAIFEEYNGSIMTAFPQLTKENIDDILAYTSEPPKKKIAKAMTSTSTSSAGSSSINNNELVLLLFSILFAVLAIALVVINRKLSQLIPPKDEKLINEKKLRRKSIVRLYIENDFLVFVTVVLLFLTSAYFVYGYMMQIGIDQNYQPVQPIHFSHKIHAGDNKIDCKYCHSSARVSKTSGVPALNVCMNCHKNIYEYNGEEDLAKGYSKKFYDEQIQKLYKATGWDSENNEYTGKSELVKWVRIHNLPNFVYFNHSQHVSVAGVKCQKCHGPVEQMDVLYQYAPLTMGWCIECHKKTDVKLKDNAYYSKIHEELSKKYDVEKVTEAQMGGLECGRCHY